MNEGEILEIIFAFPQHLRLNRAAEFHGLCSSGIGITVDGRGMLHIFFNIYGCPGLGQFSGGHF